MWKSVHKDKNPVCSVLFVVPYTESYLESSKERISKNKVLDCHCNLIVMLVVSPAFI